MSSGSLGMSFTQRWSCWKGPLQFSLQGHSKICLLSKRNVYMSAKCLAHFFRSWQNRSTDKSKANPWLFPVPIMFIIATNACWESDILNSLPYLRCTAHTTFFTCKTQIVIVAWLRKSVVTSLSLILSPFLCKNYSLRLSPENAGKAAVDGSIWCQRLCMAPHFLIQCLLIEYFSKLNSPIQCNALLSESF